MSTRLSNALITESSDSVNSSPSLDTESRDPTPMSSISPDAMNLDIVDAPIPNQIPGLMVISRQHSGSTPSMHTVEPLALPDDKFMCPRCPREFKSLARARQHIRTFRHRHSCTVPGCRWSFEAPKDLERHLPTHDAGSREVLTCPVAGCRSRRPGTFSRHDLLERHMRNFHP
ncbi:uncharacterized protein LY89DRAFT_499004 [Mollisia scopiformis]|uniref:C2H2-type domain-containing protein n=1 Tax=Mollisia scopiformis TaxID=149040 RepID=A0A194XFK4_MOLSC|nr:uncharacterized protein LY89DRAFT_499004 [Mollisia scopiformis]KUJ18552.1 hypothetical protein LY89DRAFT_499004 [Mollisia scopiformis]